MGSPVEEYWWLSPGTVALRCEVPGYEGPMWVVCEDEGVAAFVEASLPEGSVLARLVPGPGTEK